MCLGIVSLERRCTSPVIPLWFEMQADGRFFAATQAPYWKLGALSLGSYKGQNCNVRKGGVSFIFSVCVILCWGGGEIKRMSMTVSWFDFSPVICRYLIFLVWKTVAKLHWHKDLWTNWFLLLFALMLHEKSSRTSFWPVKLYLQLAIKDYGLKT